MIFLRLTDCPSVHNFQAQTPGQLYTRNDQTRVSICLELISSAYRPSHPRLEFEFSNWKQCITNGPLGTACGSHSYQVRTSSSTTARSARRVRRDKCLVNFNRMLSTKLVVKHALQFEIPVQTLDAMEDVYHYWALSTAALESLALQV